MRCGLLGKKLGHSYSPAIHAKLGDYSYGLFEKTEEELESFVKSGDWDGLNVTIPYKKAVIPFCDELSDIAKETGSVNTLVRRPDGTIYGANTDAPGFAALVKKSGISVSGEKVLVLGSGGASAAVCAALKRLGANVTVISRSGENNYENIGQHSDAAVIVNTTPVGMYPDCPAAPLSLEGFPLLKGVLDIVYNPAVTGILQEAEDRGIPCANGLYMLVSQAKRSSELFTGRSIPDEMTDRIAKEMEVSMKNIVLIGMPGAGKTVIAEQIGILTGRPVIDVDQCIEERAQKTIPEIFEKGGEELFRCMETEMLGELGRASGTILSTGGGSVTRAENYPLLHQNGTIVWIRRDLQTLAREGRPLSTGDLGKMYTERKPLYERFADLVIENYGTPKTVAESVVGELYGSSAESVAAGSGGEEGSGRKPGKKILVINGPNLNMLGIREPDLYGRETYDTLLQIVARAAEEYGFEADCFQSNHEGAIVDRIQEAYGVYDGIVINPAAYTHTSVAILDALKAVAIPAVEVHITAVEEREDFRKISYPGMACFRTITGQGLDGYRQAVQALAEHLG